MTDADAFQPIVHSVFHPTDFSEGSEVAFAHALAIAILRRARLAILHTQPEHLAEDEWSKFPPIRKTLERWGLLRAGSPRSAIFERFGVDVSKVSWKGRDPLEGILDYLSDHEVDLMVVATEGREGFPRWLAPSVAAESARKASVMTLFVPRGARSMVEPTDGSVNLERIVVPVARETPPELALRVVANAARIMSAPPIEFTLCHVGRAEGMPKVEPPVRKGWTWRQSLRSGDVVDEIVGEAEERRADLIAMTTEGHQDLMDLLRGSTTERVVRRAPCPVLAVPVSD